MFTRDGANALSCLIASRSPVRNVAAHISMHFWIYQGLLSYFECMPTRTLFFIDLTINFLYLLIYCKDYSSMSFILIFIVINVCCYSFLERQRKGLVNLEIVILIFMRNIFCIISALVFHWDSAIGVTALTGT